MTYLAGSQKTTIQASFGRGFPQSQQLPWTYAYGEDRTAVSYQALQDLEKISSIWAEKSISATFISEAQLQLLLGHYGSRNDAEVKHFLREHPFLTQLLLDTYSKIEAHFPDSQVFLEIATDYGAFDHISSVMNCDKELVASISTHLPPEEAIEALNKFYDDWWLRALEDAKGKISFGLEFV